MSSRTTTAAWATPGWASSTASISPSSIRKPRIFTCSSARPRNTSSPVAGPLGQVAGAVHPLAGRRTGTPRTARAVSPAGPGSRGPRRRRRRTARRPRPTGTGAQPVVEHVQRVLAIGAPIGTRHRRSARASSAVAARSSSRSARTSLNSGRRPRATSSPQPVGRQRPRRRAISDARRARRRHRRAATASCDGTAVRRIDRGARPGSRPTAVGSSRRPRAAMRSCPPVASADDTAPCHRDRSTLRLQQRIPARHRQPSRAGRAGASRFASAPWVTATPFGAGRTRRVDHIGQLPSGCTAGRSRVGAQASREVVGEQHRRHGRPSISTALTSTARRLSASMNAIRSAGSPGRPAGRPRRPSSTPSSADHQVDAARQAQRRPPTRRRRRGRAASRASRSARASSSRVGQRRRPSATTRDRIRGAPHLPLEQLDHRRVRGPAPRCRSSRQDQLPLAGASTSTSCSRTSGRGGHRVQHPHEPAREPLRRRRVEQVRRRPSRIRADPAGRPSPVDRPR